MKSEPENLTILIIGNVLMGDEGIGVQALRYLETQSLPPHVDLLHVGTSGYYNLSVLETYQNIIMIDATINDDPLGTLKLDEPRFASYFPKVLSSHVIGKKT